MRHPKFVLHFQKQQEDSEVIMMLVALKRQKLCLTLHTKTETLYTCLSCSTSVIAWEIFTLSTGDSHKDSYQYWPVAAITSSMLLISGLNSRFDASCLQQQKSKARSNNIHIPKLQLRETFLCNNSERFKFEQNDSTAHCSLHSCTKKLERIYRKSWSSCKCEVFQRTRAF